VNTGVIENETSEAILEAHADRQVTEVLHVREGKHEASPTQILSRNQAGSAAWVGSNRAVREAGRLDPFLLDIGVDRA
jgi:hypothetical protein